MVDFTGGTWRSLIDGSEVSAIPDDGLAHRYKADDLSLSDGDSVSTWSDLAGSDDLTQTTSSKQPTYKTGIINGQPVVRTDGTDDFLQTAFGTVINQAVEVYLVCQWASVDDNGDRIFDGETDRFLLYDRDADSSSAFMFAGDNVGTGGIADTNANIWNLIYDGSNSELRKNDTTEATGDVGANAMDGLTIGAAKDDTFHKAVDFAEIFIYAQKLSASDRDDIHSYFSDEYGITI